MVTIRIAPMDYENQQIKRATIDLSRFFEELSLKVSSRKVMSLKNSIETKTARYAYLAAGICSRARFKAACACFSCS